MIPRILNFLLGAVFVPLGMAVGAAGAARFYHAVSAMADRPMEGGEAAPYLLSLLLGLALVALAYGSVTFGWKRLKGGLRPGGAVAASAPVAAPATPVAPSPAPVDLPVVLTLSYAGQTALLTAASGEATLGRGADCRIVVASKHVSRVHAKILWDASGAPKVVNLGQMGTSVDSNAQPGYRPCEPELTLDGQGTIALSSNGADAVSRGDLIAFEVSRG